MGGTIEPLSSKATSPYVYGGAFGVYEVALTGNTLTLRSLPVDAPAGVVIVAARVQISE